MFSKWGEVYFSTYTLLLPCCYFHVGSNFSTFEEIQFFITRNVLFKFFSSSANKHNTLYQAYVVLLPSNDPFKQFLQLAQICLRINLGN